LEKLMAQSVQIPAKIFVEAVRMARIPCHKDQASHPAVEHVTDWWNATSDPEHQHAYGFALYAQFGENWLSGNPEEGWIDAATWARNPKPKAQASLSQAGIVLVFFKGVVDEDEHSFDAKAVDGSDGFSGGKGADETSGNSILTRYAHDALSRVPDRFPELWRIACEQAGMAATPANQG
jgi:hypothetical protein